MLAPRSRTRTSTCCFGTRKTVFLGENSQLAAVELAEQSDARKSPVGREFELEVFGGDCVIAAVRLEIDRVKSNHPPPPIDAPPGTVWLFGGPVACISACLRVLGENLNPDEISKILGCSPTQSARKGDAVCRPTGEVLRHRRIGSWLLELDSTIATTLDLDEAILQLISTIPKDPKIWHALSERFDVDLLCHVRVRGVNQGFILSPEAMREIAALGIPLGVDIFCQYDEEQAGLLNDRLRTPDEPDDARESPS